MMAEDLGGTLTMMVEAPFSLSLPLYFFVSLFSRSVSPISVAIFLLFYLFIYFKQLVSFYLY